MPLEIRELVIKAVVDQGQTQGANTSPGKGSPASTASGEDIIKECVDKVLAILKEKNER